MGDEIQLIQSLQLGSIKDVLNAVQIQGVLIYFISPILLILLIIILCRWAIRKFRWKFRNKTYKRLIEKRKRLERMIEEIDKELERYKE